MSNTNRRDPEKMQPGESHDAYKQRRYLKLITDLARGANYHAFAYLIDEKEQESHVLHYLHGGNSRAGIEFMAKAIDFWENFAETHAEEYAELVASYRSFRQHTRDFEKANQNGEVPPPIPDNARGILKKIENFVVPNLINFANITEVKERYFPAFKATADTAAAEFSRFVKHDIESGGPQIIKVLVGAVVAKLQSPPQTYEN